jgi:hypothetical protein
VGYGLLNIDQLDIDFLGDASLYKFNAFFSFTNKLFPPSVTSILYYSKHQKYMMSDITLSLKVQM